MRGGAKVVSARNERHVLQRIVNRDEPVWLVPIVAATLLAIVMIYWTHSKAAMATFGLALLTFTAIAVARPWLAALPVAGCYISIPSLRCESA